MTDDPCPGWTIKLVGSGARAKLLMMQAYLDEGLPLPDIDETFKPVCLLYPRSFVDAVEAMGQAKIHDYCFMGSVYLPQTFPQRSWILDWARERFTEDSCFIATDGIDRHESLGPFDRSLDSADVFIPRQVPLGQRGYFHARYFEMLCRSQFTLCPAGDAPWSNRFFDAVMCRSIPVLSSPEHSGRHQLEWDIGYTFAMADEVHHWDPALAERNFQLFLEHQTLMRPADHRA